MTHINYFSQLKDKYFKNPSGIHNKNLLVFVNLSHIFIVCVLLTSKDIILLLLSIFYVLLDIPWHSIDKK